jgi:hypothetical protein
LFNADASDIHCTPCIKQVPVPLIPSADDFAEVAAQKAQELQQQMDEELKKAGL